MRSRKKWIPVCLSAVLMTALLSGCGDKKIVFTTGLASDELFRIGDVSCKLPEALVYLNTQKNQYENVYGIEMWEQALGDMTMEEYLKSQVISQLAQVKSMVLLAEEKEISLTEEEKNLAGTAAGEYFTSLSETEVNTLKLKEDEIQKMYEDYCLAFKAYDQITEDVSVEISDDEARIIKLQQIFVPEENLANELRGKLDNGEEFDVLAANYSQASQTTVSVARGDRSEEYEEIAFDLDNEEVSGVFAADGGYYILKCLNTYMEEESEENKVRVAQQQRTERFQGIYSDLMKDTLSEFQQKLWDGIRFEDYEEVKTDSFFEVYQKHFQS
ncbi:MAG: peptidyl-prolyl cis-trans isomerase [Clostridiales bacterium]|nr:peptidyl-prolyl cis-trans isomerase [Clostridiales bacterium]